MEFNKYQTQITDELRETLVKDEYEILIDYISNVPFINNLIKPDREYAKNRPLDSLGRIIVDITNPHILENMDYFRPSALHFKKYGCFTLLRPNSNPNSEFGKWLKEEINRIWYGMVRPSDGEWIPGDYYWYLNYCPILQAEAEKGKNKANRIEDFPKIYDGDYLYFHYIDQARNGGMYNDWKGGQHAAMIARRGCGKSYKNGATLAKYFIVGENERACKEVKSLACASEKEYLIKDGILNKFVSFIDFCAEHTEFPRARLKDSLGDMIWKMGYKDVVLGINKGTENEVMGVTTKDNADKARGKRANKMIYEEFGKYSNFIQTWNTNRFNVEDGDYAFGQAVAFGTGGTENSDFSGALEMIYNPRGYGIYPLPNVFNKNSKGASTTIFFFGAFMNRTGYMDKDGNSDVIGAMISVLKSRSNIKYNSTDPLTLTQKIAEEPFTIDEAIMRRDGTLFPVSDLTDLLNEIKENQRDFLSSHYIGRLVQNSNGEIEWKPDADIQILRTYKIKDNRKEGGLEIFEMPKKNSSGSVYSNRYIVSCDPIDDDGADTTSLFAFHILDLWTDRIVAEYAGRYSFAEDNYEELRKALLFYNARVLYENNKKGLFAWFSNRNSLYLLADVPQILKDVELMKGNLYGNRNKGYSGSVPSNAMGRRLLRDWLLKPIKELVTKKDENGNFYEEEVTFRNLKRLRGMATIEELIQWDPDGNYDRVSSLTALMLYREEMYKYIIQNETERERVDSNYIGNDPFFDVFDPQKMNTKWMKFQNSHNSS